MKKKETIEEAAQKRFPIDYESDYINRYANLNSTANFGFVEGAKWQAEIMYSEEILDVLDNVRYWETCPDKYKIIIEEFFKQFKNK